MCEECIKIKKFLMNPLVWQNEDVCQKCGKKIKILGKGAKDE